MPRRFPNVPHCAAAGCCAATYIEVAAAQRQVVDGRIEVRLELGRVGTHLTIQVATRRRRDATCAGRRRRKSAPSVSSIGLVRGMFCAACACVACKPARPAWSAPLQDPWSGSVCAGLRRYGMAMACLDQLVAENVQLARALGTLLFRRRELAQLRTPHRTAAHVKNCAAACCNAVRCVLRCPQRMPRVRVCVQQRRLEHGAFYFPLACYTACCTVEMIAFKISCHMLSVACDLLHVASSGACNTVRCALSAAVPPPHPTPVRTRHAQRHTREHTHRPPACLLRLSVPSLRLSGTLSRLSVPLRRTLTATARISYCMRSDTHACDSCVRVRR